MDDRTLKFLIFVVFNLACFTLGYVSRRRGWVAEGWSRPIHLHTLIWLWSPVTLLAFWGLPMHGPGARDLAILMLAQPVLMVAGALVMAPLAKRIGCGRAQRGPMILAASLSNHGFTLGAYLCYALLQPAEVALGYGIAYVTSMQVFMILIFYPVAHHFGPEDSGSLPRLIAGSFFTLRSLPLYAAAVGAALNLAGIAPGLTARLSEWGVMDALFFAGGAGAYIGIGLRFRAADSWDAPRMHGALAMVNFVAHPLFAVALVALLGWTAGPLTRDVILIQSFMPAALNTVMVSNLFHLDARRASALWLWNTLLFCAAPLPVLLWLYAA